MKEGKKGVSAKNPVLQQKSAAEFFAEVMRPFLWRAACRRLHGDLQLQQQCWVQNKHFAGFDNVLTVSAFDLLAGSVSEAVRLHGLSVRARLARVWEQLFTAVGVRDSVTPSDGNRCLQCQVSKIMAELGDDFKPLTFEEFRELMMGQKQKRAEMMSAAGLDKLFDEIDRDKGARRSCFSCTHEHAVGGGPGGRWVAVGARPRRARYDRLCARRFFRRHDR